jgi:type II secretory pathway predicted ATPase ExeA
MEKFFNTEGPGNEEDHYMIDPLKRINYIELLTLIKQKRYFVLHAPRQTGKTTSLRAIVDKLNREGEYACVYVNVEAAQAARNNVSVAMTGITKLLGQAIKRHIHDDSFVNKSSNDITALNMMLTDLSEKLDKPLVLLIDEIDSLIGDTLVSVLRQLRSGYTERPKSFPIAIILCGVRDIRDYRIHQSDGEIITGGSCFNIKAESIRLSDFSLEEIHELYEQHTKETGQIFEEALYPKVWDLTHGQPWLVNALAREATSKTHETEDQSKPITLDIIEQAAYQLVLKRETHLDQLADKLREPRVRKVIEPMLMGEDFDADKAQRPTSDDFQYVTDLGLIRTQNGNTVISNAIYREILPRELTYITQIEMSRISNTPWYISENGSIDIEKLLKAFQQFFRENIDSWKRSGDYEEAGFQLLLQAYLQRIMNGGGQLEREYALGTRRVDLLMRYRYPAEVLRSEQSEQRVVFELKVINDKAKTTSASVLNDGLKQTYEYSLISNAESSHLIICDQRSSVNWDEKIYDLIEYYNDLAIHVWGV